MSLKTLFSAAAFATLSLTHSPLAFAQESSDPKPTPPPSVKRIHVGLATWQEPLRLQNFSGTSTVEKANYKGLVAGYERTIPRTWGGFAITGLVGNGLVSGGKIGGPVDYAQGSIPWFLFGLEPKIYYTVSERVNLGLSLAGIYRSVSWPEENDITVSPSRSLNVVTSFVIDVNLTERWGLHQSFGFLSSEAGPFWRWSLSFRL